jgi:hypothetical protein
MHVLFGDEAGMAGDESTGLNAPTADSSPATGGLAQVSDGADDLRDSGPSSPRIELRTAAGNEPDGSMTGVPFPRGTSLGERFGVPQSAMRPHALLGHGAGTATRIAFVLDVQSVFNRFFTFSDWLGGYVKAMRPTQSFCIIPYGGDVFAHDNHLDLQTMLPATEANKRDAALTGAMTPGRLEGMVDALQLAFGQHPDLICLITDEWFFDDAPVLAALRNLRKTWKARINTVAYVSPSDTDTDCAGLLKQIAAETGGEYRRVAESQPGQ